MEGGECLEKMIGLMSDFSGVDISQLDLDHHKEYNFAELFEKCKSIEDYDFLWQQYSKCRDVQNKQYKIGLVHGDFSWSNFIYTLEDEMYILDNDHLRTDALIQDIARALIFFAFNDLEFSQEKANRVLELYTNMSNITFDIDEVLSWTRLLLIFMILETYYYTEVVRTVSKGELEKSSYNQGYKYLFYKLKNLVF